MVGHRSPYRTYEPLQSHNKAALEFVLSRNLVALEDSAENH